MRVFTCLCVYACACVRIRRIEVSQQQAYLHNVAQDADSNVGCSAESNEVRSGSQTGVEFVAGEIHNVVHSACPQEDLHARGRVRWCHACSGSGGNERDENGLVVNVVVQHALHAADHLDAAEAGASAQDGEKEAQERTAVFRAPEVPAIEAFANLQERDDGRFHDQQSSGSSGGGCEVGEHYYYEYCLCGQREDDGNRKRKEKSKKKKKKLSEQMSSDAPRSSRNNSTVLHQTWCSSTQGTCKVGAYNVRSRAFVVCLLKTTVSVCLAVVDGRACVGCSERAGLTKWG